MQMQRDSTQYYLSFPQPATQHGPYKLQNLEASIPLNFDLPTQPLQAPEAPERSGNRPNSPQNGKTKARAKKKVIKC